MHQTYTCFLNIISFFFRLFDLFFVFLIFFLFLFVFYCSISAQPQKRNFVENSALPWNAVLRTRIDVAVNKIGQLTIWVPRPASSPVWHGRQNNNTTGGSLSWDYLAAASSREDRQPKVAIVHPFSRVKTDRRHQKPRPSYFAQWILLCIRMWAQLTSRLENAHLRDSLSSFISVNILRYTHTTSDAVIVHTNLRVKVSRPHYCDFCRVTFRNRPYCFSLPFHSPSFNVKYLVYSV